MIATRVSVTASFRPGIDPASETGDFVVGTVSYLEDANQTPVAYNLPQECGMPARSGRFVTFPVRIRNARDRAPDLSLDGAGIALHSTLRLCGIFLTTAKSERSITLKSSGSCAIQRAPRRS